MAGMKKISPWEVWWAKVRFEDNPSIIKERPVVVTGTKELLVIALKVTSQPPRSGEYVLLKWKEAGLMKQSTVRVGKRLLLTDNDLVRKMGMLQAQDIINIQKMMRNISAR